MSVASRVLNDEPYVLLPYREIDYGSKKDKTFAIALAGKLLFLKTLGPTIPFVNDADRRHANRRDLGG